PLQRLERPDDRHQLHAVIGRRGLAAPELLLLALVAQDDTPAAGTGVAPARAVGIDLHRFIPHGGSCGCAGKPAPAPAAARARPATPASRAACRARASRRG